MSSNGEELFADRNRVAVGDHTRHPEFEVARWAAAHLSEAELSQRVRALHAQRLV